MNFMLLLKIVILFQTGKGELMWQNELNSKNKLFFDVCDGIFLNYTWKAGRKTQSSSDEEDLQFPHDSLQTSLDSLKNAERKPDIYVGVDVFGRGCFGGGGFNTRKALEIIR